MMSNNKILTVSYGTFSCTLEGFDDSFGTMKAIAEYFRDLASDDRYFGAEPPQPDAQMLASIAQKEVSRRVQARERDGQIVLSAVEENKSAAPQAAVASAAHLAQPEPVAPDLAAPPAPSAKEAPAEEKPVVVEAPELLAETADVQPLQVETPVAPKPEAVQADPAPTDIVPGQPDSEVEAFFEEAADDDAIEAVNEEPAVADATADETPSVAETIAEPDTPAPDSIAAKLQRIRAVVAQHEETDDDEDYLEDEHAAAPSEPSVDDTDMLADARNDIENALAADNEEYLSDAAAEKTNADVLKILQQTDEDDEDIAEEDDLADSIMALDTEASLDAAEPIDNFFDEDQDADVTQLRADDSLLKDEDTDDASSIEDDEAEMPPRRPRVIKVRRAELDEAIENGDLEEYEDDLQPTQSPTSLDELAPAKTAERALSPEDEDDLVKELAALEAGADADQYVEDDSPDSTDQFEDDEDDLEETSSQMGRDGLPSIDEDPDSDINRLMAETDHQMGEPEGATRREAFAQLRAAVAAKKADTAISGDEDKGDDGEAYRDDLAEVVRPRRPVSGSSRTERPGGDRPAPLKLVAEQRIDVDKPRSAGPVRPRRVAAVVETAPSDPDAESFADYAADMGATKLPELLEAAAAYMSFVEGLDQFSRPQLMNTVRQAGPEEGFSREDGLRSFGQLLRSGKIEKIKGGRFTVSDDIGYQPDERAAG